MKRRVVLSPPAQDDTERIRAWFLQPGSGAIAHTRLMKLEATIAALGVFPKAHKPGPNAGSRLLISQGHKVLYEIAPDAAGAETGDVIILRIFGPGQSTT